MRRKLISLLSSAVRQRITVSTAFMLAVPAVVIVVSAQVQTINSQREASARAQDVVDYWNWKGVHVKDEALRLTEQHLADAEAQRDAALQDDAQQKARADKAEQERDQYKSQLIAQTAYSTTASGGMGGGAVRTLSSLTPGVHNRLGPFDASRFCCGQCTTFVASWKPVTWLGNAGQWLWNAAAQGVPTGGAPRAGAIMVSAESWFGHVALVEVVYRDGSFLVSEMNYAGQWYIDQRVVRPWIVPVKGFIYL